MIVRTHASAIEILEARIAPATFRWDVNGAGNWNDQNNWFNETTGLANNGFPNAVDDVAKFLGVITANATVTIPNVSITVGSLIFDDNNAYTIAATGSGALTLNGAVSAGITVNAANTGAHVVTAPLVLADSLTINHLGTGTLTMSTYSDGGAGSSLTKDGPGTVTFTPSAASTIAGTTTVNAGTLNLSTNARLGGAVLVGGGAAAAVLNALSGNHIADTAEVTVKEQGTYTLNGSDTIGALTVSDGTVVIASGATSALTVSSLAMTGGSVQMNLIGQTLNLSGNVSATASASSAQITGGVVNLGPATRTFDIVSGGAAPAMTVTSAISSVTAGVGLVKSGNGALQFAGTSPNAFPGGVTVNDGLLLLSKSSGATAVTGTLTIGDGVGGTDADGVRLFGINQISNASIVVVNSTGLLDLNGNSDQVFSLTILGGHATTGGASADLSVTNTLSMNGGRIELPAVGSRLRTATNFTVPAGSFGEAVIEGAGTFAPLGPGVGFAISDTSATRELVIKVPFTGTGAVLVKSGPGTLVLEGLNTHDGGTSVTGGTLRVDGTIGAVTVNGGAVLTGGGTTGVVTTASNATVRTDSLTVAGIATAAPATLAFHIDGTSPGDGPGFYDQLVVAGTVTLNNATLNLTGSADFPPGEAVVIIDNDGTDAVTGTFNFLPEGAEVSGGGRNYLISYKGGDGNDVVLFPKQYFVFEGGTAPDGDDVWVIRRDVADEKLLHVTVQTGGTSTVVDVSLNQFAGVSFLGGAGDDAVLFDATFGYFTSSFQFTNEILFDGGSGNNIVNLGGSGALPEVENVNFFSAGTSGGSVQYSNNFEVQFSNVGRYLDGLPAAKFEYFGSVNGVGEISLQPGLTAAEVVVGQAGQVPVTLRSKGAIVLNGQGTADHFHVGSLGAGSTVNSILVNNVFTPLATLTVAGTNGSDTFTFGATGITGGTVARTGQPTVTYTGAMAVALEGGPGDDTFQITAGTPLGTIVSGGPGSDTLSFSGSSAAVGFNADVVGSSQTLNGLAWELTFQDPLENFTGSNNSDSITIAPGAAVRSVSDPNGSMLLFLDGRGSALTIDGPVLNNASGSVTVTGRFDPTLVYSNVGVVRTFNVPFVPPPAFGAAGNTFAAPLDFAVGKGPIALATGDLNGDGRADFVTANAKGGTISIALSAPVGLLQEAVVKPTGGLKPTGVAIGDFNSDGEPDIAVTNAGAGNVAIFLNDGTGGFGTPTAFLTGKVPGVLRVGDVDGDNDLDLATIISGNKVAILKGNGDGTFANATTLATGGLKPKDLALADMDGDGDLDMLALHAGGQLATHLNDSTGSFSAPTVARTGLGASALAVADFNNDGRLDAAVTHNAVSRFVAVVLGKGTGEFFPMLKIAHPLPAKAAAVAASDFDGDGFADLAIANGSGGKVSILRSLGTGGFARAIDIILEDLPPRKLSTIALGDFDGDGRLDIVAASGASNEVSLITRA